VLVLSSAEEPFAPWGTFDLRFAAPEVVSVALGLPIVAKNGSSLGAAVPPPAAEASASADVWSFGMLLFHATAAQPYWPPEFALLDITQALLGHTSLPHECNTRMLDECGRLATLVARMLSRSPAARPTVLDIGELAAASVGDVIRGLYSKDVRHHITPERVLTGQLLHGLPETCLIV
jgi:serine/threonine protein kinase